MPTRRANLTEHFGRIRRQKNISASGASVHSDSSVSFSETVLGRLLAKEGLVATNDFEVGCRGSKKHFYSNLTSNVEKTEPAFLKQRPKRATRVLPTYPTTWSENTRLDDSVDLESTSHFDGDDLFLLHAIEVSFSKRIVYTED